MNERIKQMVDQFAQVFLIRTGYDMRTYEPFLEESEKFAELIVGECAEIVYQYGEYAAEEIKEHFGFNDERSNQTASRKDR